MSAQEFFYISVGVGAWIIVILGVIITYKAMKTFRKIQDTVKGYQEVKKDLNLVGNAMKIGTLSVISKLLSKVDKRG